MEDLPLPLNRISSKNERSQPSPSLHSRGAGRSGRESVVDYAESISTIDRPPEADLPPSKIYHPLSLHILAILAPASIFGALARLGFLALVDYDGQSIFPLAFVQAIGCVVMGFGIVSKDAIGKL